uniref:Uncharacterized protein n=1 Tax=Romanomermis culicivorax TaxID=13658 RepID=A0A915I2U8_ROMCU
MFFVSEEPTNLKVASDNCCITAFLQYWSQKLKGDRKVRTAFRTWRMYLTDKILKLLNLNFPPEPEYACTSRKIKKDAKRATDNLNSCASFDIRTILSTIVCTSSTHGKVEQARLVDVTHDFKASQRRSQEEDNLSTEERSRSSVDKFFKQCDRLSPKYTNLWAERTTNRLLATKSRGGEFDSTLDKKSSMARLEKVKT